MADVFTLPLPPHRALPPSAAHVSIPRDELPPSHTAKRKRVAGPVPL